MGWIADLLKEIPSAARYKAELEDMERENAELKSKIAVLESENKNLRQEIERRDDVIKDKESHSERLEEIRERILFLLGQVKNIKESTICNEIGISEQVAKYHLAELRKSKLANYPPIIGVKDRQWHITQEGRAYLVAHGLLE